VDIQAELEDLRFNVARSIRYHDGRRGYFDLMQKTATWISLVASSGAVLAFGDEKTALAIGLTVGVAITSALTVGFEFSSKLILYTDLRGRFLELESQIAACTTPNEADIVRLTQLRKEIERGEPTISKALNLIAFNETCDALGRDPKHKVKLGWWQKVRGHTYLG
jgi:hypothetical protein